MTVARPAVGRVPVWFTLASIGPVLRCVALVGVGWGRWCGGEVGASGGMLLALARWLISSIHIFMNRAPVLAGVVELIGCLIGGD